MGLRTDIIFAKALQANEHLMKRLPAGNVYNPAITLPDDEVDNAPIPYIIIGLTGVQNDDTYKDDDWEGVTDHVQITIIVAAAGRKQLGELTESVRDTIRTYFAAHKGDTSDADFCLIPDDITFTAGPVQYDSIKPCFWQELSYNCNTNP